MISRVRGSPSEAFARNTLDRDVDFEENTCDAFDGTDDYRPQSLPIGVIVEKQHFLIGAVVLEVATVCDLSEEGREFGVGVSELQVAVQVVEVLEELSEVGAENREQSQVVLLPKILRGEVLAEGLEHRGGRDSEQLRCGTDEGERHAVVIVARKLEGWVHVRVRDDRRPRLGAEL